MELRGGANECEGIGVTIDHLCVEKYSRGGSALKGRRPYISL